MAFLILDIETVPRASIDDAVESEIIKKTKARVERTGDEYENAESLIRSTSPFFGKVLCIGMRFLSDDGKQKDKVICEDNEKLTLIEFFKIINKISSNIKFIHYNGMGFDIPFLIVRAAHHGIEITNWNFKDLRRFSYKSHIDLMMFLCNWNSYNSVSMDIACRSFGILSPKEGDVKGDSVAKAYSEGNIAGVEEYVMKDVEATHQLYEKLKIYIR
ncbi:MAG: ribonuclease H-like domain-containing protein [Candidatus Neomarinimicrobiota bacterium]|nr:ribonuclease H-like domain-containing protein [Candidatus Neomarinimicrobiota bacterium]|tara:strand:- start:893 stop:1540 length:648 start_codon:yes stop_codon:yes gene_type:complete